MKIIVIGGHTVNPGDLSWDRLSQLGELTVYDRFPEDEDELIKLVCDADILIPNKCNITKKLIDGCPNLKMISVLATGFNNIDIRYAREKGIVVSNVPSYGTDAVGQYAIALLLEICSRVAHHDIAVHEGRWGQDGEWCFWDYPLIELAGKTMGIIGFGRIGRATGRIAKAMGMHVLATGSRETEDGRLIAEYTDMDTVLRSSDVICLHCPALPDTVGIINRETIAKMKDGVIIINNSRGQLVVEQDLADALNSGKVYAAGLDVVSVEPIRDDNPLLHAKNCIITPHISWVPREARGRIINTTFDNISAFLKGESLDVVN